VFALIALAGCTSKPSSDQGNGAATTVSSSVGQPAGGSHPVIGYPAWAAAIVPPYPSNVKSASATTEQIYQIDTADPYETVLAWYKAHVRTTWPDRHPHQTVGRVGNVAITLQQDVDPTSPNDPRTTIGFIKH
jgi:hypothetical protein